MNHQKNYNGWKNYETWLTALWIDNEYSCYQYRCELVEQARREHSSENKRKNCLALSLEEWIEEQNPLADDNNLFVDLLNSALGEVDWYEIAENYLSE